MLKPGALAAQYHLGNIKVTVAELKAMHEVLFIWQTPAPVTITPIVRS